MITLGTVLAEHVSSTVFLENVRNALDRKKSEARVSCQPLVELRIVS